jgi:multidrug efflux pump subunit AcrB
MTSIEDVRGIPITADKGKSTLLRNVATVQAGTMVGEYDRYNMDRMVTVTANIENTDLGSAAKQVEAAIAQLGKPPARVSIASRGQVQPLTGLLSALQTGLLLATLVIFLLLAGNFQSVQLALIAILTAPAAIAGAALALWLWGSTLNLESFMGAIMAVGVAVANAILLVTFAERSRIAGKSSIDAAREGAESRLRPILMTSLAMIAGMLPMAIGFGSTGGQAAPLGQAVVGGLATATVATLLVLPGAFALIRANAGRHSPSLDPDDPSSRFAKPS